MEVTWNCTSFSFWFFAEIHINQSFEEARVIKSEKRSGAAAAASKLAAANNREFKGNLLEQPTSELGERKSKRA